jgi:hypothetical protein
MEYRAARVRRWRQLARQRNHAETTPGGTAQPDQSCSRGYARPVNPRKVIEVFVCDMQGEHAAAVSDGIMGEIDYYDRVYNAEDDSGKVILGIAEGRLFLYRVLRGDSTAVLALNDLGELRGARFDMHRGVLADGLVLVGYTLMHPALPHGPLHISAEDLDVDEYAQVHKDLLPFIKGPAPSGTSPPHGDGG